MEDTRRTVHIGAVSTNRGKSSKGGPISVGILFIIAAVLLTKSSWFSARIDELTAWANGHGTSTVVTGPAKPGKTVTSAATAPAATAPITTGAQPAGALAAVHSPGAMATDIKLSPGQCHTGENIAASGMYLPDPTCTPGAIDPAVTQANIASTICTTGYTSTVRPTSSITATFKTLSVAQYGLSYSKTTEYDHLISLELGGTNSVKNLWPEQNRSAATGTTNPKDGIENKLHKAVCAHQVTLSAAQHAIATNWTTAESVLGIAS